MLKMQFHVCLYEICVYICVYVTKHIKYQNDEFTWLALA